MNPLDYVTHPSLTEWTGLPVTLDFETFYCTKTKYDLRHMTVEAYVRDPRFHVHGLSVKMGAKPTRWIAGADRVAIFLSHISLNNALCVAHNVHFDGFILSEIYGVYPRLWADTMAMAAQIYGNNLPTASLKGLAKRFLPAELQKNKAALESIDGIRYLTKEQMQNLSIYGVQDSDMTYALYVMFKQVLDQRPLELPLGDMITKMFTDPNLILDGELLATIKDSEAVAKAEAVDQCIAPNIKALRSNDQFATLLLGCNVEVPMKISPTTGKDTYAFAKTDKPFTDLLMDDDPIVRDLIKSRLRVKSSIEETRAQNYYEVSTRGSWPVSLVVSGARTTHRLTGNMDGGGNAQNLTVVGKSRLRLAISAPEDMHLMMADSSAVELRVAMTLAGETDVVSQWADPAFDLYSTFVAYLLSIAVAEVTPEQRKLGKVSVLSLQYGSAAETFRQMAWNRGVELSPHEAAVIVVKYRAAFPHIPRTWNTLKYVLNKLMRGEVEETCFDHLARANPMTVAGCPGIDTAGGMPITYPKLAYVYDTQNERRVPMYVTYEKQRRAEDTVADAQMVSYAGSKPMRKYLYGAKMFGHICQNAARNIVLPQTLAVDHWLRAEVHPDCKSAMSIHDEGGWLIPDESFNNCTPDDVLRGTLEIMRTPPVWWPEIPLDAEGAIGKVSYGECK